VLCGDWEPERVFFRQKEGFEALALQLVLGRRAVALDASARRVTLDDASVHDYDALVLACGAKPRTLPGSEGMGGVFTLRTLDDALAIRAALARRPRVAVIGAGFIGLEVAASCRKLGLSVTIVEARRTPLAPLLGEAVGAALLRMHEGHGVEWRTGVTVARLQGAAHLERIVLSDGRVLDAELAIVGIGVSPCTQWLVGSGLRLDDGVVCDARCATNLPSVFAAGDVARFHNTLWDESMRIEHWSNAGEHAQLVAAAIMGDETQTSSSVPYFWSDQYDVKLQFAGRARESDTTRVVHGSLSDKSYVLAYGRQGRLSGVLASNAPKALIRGRKLLSERSTFDAAIDALQSP
jgi:NADPH-dependent 2,4-dienoyl-CoA reductase/sulfur reductase-like enzyme